MAFQVRRAPFHYEKADRYTEVSTATAEEYQKEYDEAMQQEMMPMPEEEEK